MRTFALRTSRISAIVALSLAAMPVRAVMPDEVLSDPALESRARILSQELRCVVCQNQSIDDSNAPLARDLRILLRDRLLSGDSDRQALDFIVQRYGNFVLLKPPLNLNTLLLWIGPFVILLLAGIGFGRYVTGSRDRSRPAEALAPLNEEEQLRVKAILEERRPA